jgi:hypothetical protein
LEVSLFSPPSFLNLPFIISSLDFSVSFIFLFLHFSIPWSFKSSSPYLNILFSCYIRVQLFSSTFYLKLLTTYMARLVHQICAFFPHSF